MGNNHRPVAMIALFSMRAAGGDYIPNSVVRLLVRLRLR